MRFFSLSVVAGGFACNARCPFCVASMTPLSGVTAKAREPNLVAFRETCAYVKEHGVEQIMITSKGEPTLWPDHITSYLQELSAVGFANVDLQTNGIPIADRKPVSDAHLLRWRELGLKLVAISVVHWEPQENKKIYVPHRDYIDLPALIDCLHAFGFEVRLSVVMLNGYIDSGRKLAQMLEFTRSHGVEQLTIRPVNKPEETRDDDVSKYIAQNHLLDEQKADIARFLETGATESSDGAILTPSSTLVRTLPWGARIYQINGQNVCLTNSLTKDNPDVEIGRQLIFFADGTVSTSWENASQPLIQLVTGGTQPLVQLEVKK